MTDKRAPAGASEASVLLANALQEARAAIGSEADAERLRVRFDSTLGGGARPEPPALTTTPRLAVLGAKGWTLVLGAALGFGGLMYAVSGSSWPARREGTPRAVSAAAVARTIRAEPMGTQLLPADGTAPVVPATIAGPIAHGAATSTARAARVQASARRAPRPVGTGNAMVVPATRVQADPEAEIALVSRAQNVLTQRPLEALAVLTEHEQLFPHGVLAQERDTLRIDAERALGQNARAREHARMFVTQFPQSPQARALKQWLATSEPGSSVHNAQPAPVLTR